MARTTTITLMALMLSAAFTMPAHAVANFGTYSFLKNTPAQQFTDEDWKMFEDTLNGALNEAADGASKTWENPNTKASGEIKILKTVKKGDMDCRELKITNQSKDRKRTTGQIFCKQPDASWKVFTGKPKNR